MHPPLHQKNIEQPDVAPNDMFSPNSNKTCQVSEQEENTNQVEANLQLI